jgi:4-hydroxy-tetrahydrodipicolinate reductase
LELVGAVDVDPIKIGNDVGDIIGLGRRLGFVVAESLDAIATSADVATHTTSSYFEQFKDQVIEILEAGLDVVSTAEELSFPWLAHPQEGAEIDAVARRTGKTVLGTGVNPGFVMDALPLFLTGICQRVDHIEVTRVINASNRRGPFQIKIGSGMSVQDFQAKMAAARMGHVGLPESIAMVLDTLGKKLTRYESSVQPVIADEWITTEHLAVAPGDVAGLKQIARGYTDEGEFISLLFLAALNAVEEGDTIRIAGKPDLEVRLTGTNGDLATVALVGNAIRRVRDANPGLITMRDLPMVTA